MDDLNMFHMTVAGYHLEQIEVKYLEPSVAARISRIREEMIAIAEEETGLTAPRERRE
jgi:hypothetical protein